MGVFKPFTFKAILKYSYIHVCPVWKWCLCPQWLFFASFLDFLPPVLSDVSGISPGPVRFVS